MIRVALAPAPDRFDDRVRNPGLAFLVRCPSPTSKEWEKASYWRRCLADLRKAYGDVCAYTATYIAPDTGSESVEHFVPKSVDPLKAYEWDNFRYVCLRLNGRRGVKSILDPFQLPDDIFEIVFPAMELRVSSPSRFDPALVKIAERTIDVLGLNDEESCVKGRREWAKLYAEGVNLDFIARRAPLVAREIHRQSISRAFLSDWLRV